jgi:hypothetical protein
LTLYVRQARYPAPGGQPLSTGALWIAWKGTRRAQAEADSPDDLIHPRTAPINGILPTFGQNPTRRIAAPIAGIAVRLFANAKACSMQQVDRFNKNIVWLVSEPTLQQYLNGRLLPRGFLLGSRLWQHFVRYTERFSCGFARCSLPDDLSSVGAKPFNVDSALNADRQKAARGVSAFSVRIG